MRVHLKAKDRKDRLAGLTLLFLAFVVGTGPPTVADGVLGMLDETLPYKGRC